MCLGRNDDSKNVKGRKEMTTETKVKYAVWKYPIPIQDSFELVIPKYGRILTLKTQRGQPTLWVLVNPENEKVTKKFSLVGTGHPVSQETFNGTFIGTYLVSEDTLVFHLFELLSDF